MKNKTSDADAEVSEATTKSKKHVTLEEKPSSRSNSPKIKASSATGTDIRNRYLMIFPLFIHRRQTHAHTQEWKSFLIFLNENYAKHKTQEKINTRGA